MEALHVHDHAPHGIVAEEVATWVGTAFHRIGVHVIVILHVHTVIMHSVGVTHEFHVRFPAMVPGFVRFSCSRF